jgi:hypothetical protein
MKHLIALCGKKRSGKTTAAEQLQHMIGPSCYRFSFADAIKSEVRKIFGNHADDRKEIIRPVYQSVGEAAKQLFGQLVWVEVVERQIKAMADYQAVIVIDDLRFPFEAEWARRMGGEVWRIRRPETDCLIDTHVSETEVENVLADLTIINDSTKTYYDKIQDAYTETKNKQNISNSGRELHADRGGD